MSERHNISTITRLIDIVNEHDLAALREIIHPDFKRHDLSAALPEVHGAGGTKDILQLLLHALPDLRIEIKQIFGSTDRVVAHITTSGTHQGELMGIPGTGKRIEVNSINIYQVKDGMLLETWQLMDVWGLMRQVGKS